MGGFITQMEIEKSISREPRFWCCGVRLGLRWYFGGIGLLGLVLLIIIVAGTMSLKSDTANETTKPHVGMIVAQGLLLLFAGVLGLTTVVDADLKYLKIKTDKLKLRRVIIAYTVLHSLFLLVILISVGMTPGSVDKQMTDYKQANPSVTEDQMSGLYTTAARTQALAGVASILITLSVSGLIGSRLYAMYKWLEVEEKLNAKISK